LNTKDLDWIGFVRYRGIVLEDLGGYPLMKDLVLHSDQKDTEGRRWPDDEGMSGHSAAGAL